MNDDFNIKNILHGKWRSIEDNNTIRYFDRNGTFIDSFYATPCPFPEPGLDTLNVCTELDSNGLFLDRVVYGKYTLKDSILNLQPIDFVIDCNPLNEPACWIYFNKLIEFNGADTLILKTIKVWKSINNYTNNIWGDWESNYWVWAYHNELPPDGAPQLLRVLISFYPDSAYFHQRIIGLPYSGITGRGQFIYNPPLLKIIVGNEKYNVSFDQNIMKWLDIQYSQKYYKL
jgi:hypothetical protein